MELPPGATLFALLVGINEYANGREIPLLGGCINDVIAIEQLLRSGFNVPPEHICVLKNLQATHGAIEHAFREHFINRARARSQPSHLESAPAFLFHFSGHGSQALDETGTEPDGLDETLVPYDGRTRGVYDIKDWELGQWLDELTQFSDNVTVVLDCCHSGSGTRDMQTSLVATRRCSPDLRSQQTPRPPLDASMRSLSTASGWMESERHVLLSACRDREEANEIAAHDNGRACRHGALTYALLQELSQVRPGRQLTYRELHERIRYRVNSIFADQMPQCEGDRDRFVFGGLRPVRDVFLTVAEKREGYVWVDGGIAHGLTEGSQLTVFPPDTRTLADAGPPLATLRVEEVGAVQSGCVVEAGEVDIPLHARAIVYRVNHGDMQRRVLLDASPSPIVDKLRACLAEADVAPHVRSAGAGVPGDFRIRLVESHLHLQDSTGKLLVAPYDSSDVNGVADDLVHLIRYHNALELCNTASHSELAGAISLAVKKLAFHVDTQQPMTKPFDTTNGGELIVELGQPLVLEVTNHAERDLYFALFDFSYDWSVTQLYPRVRGAHEALRAGKTYALGLSRKRTDQLVAKLPPDVTEARQVVKVIATTEDADFEILEQGALKAAYTKRRAIGKGGRPVSALSRLLELAMAGGRTRALGPPPASVDDEWTTAQVEFRLQRSIDDPNVVASLRGGTVATLPGYRLELKPPEGFKGNLRILTSRQASRAAGDALDLQPPPGLAGLSPWFEPAGVKAVHDGGSAGMVIEIEADATARKRVTPQTPLRLRLPTDAARAGAYFVLAYDGSLYYPVGRASDELNTLHVDWLPELSPANELPVRSRRGLGRTVKLYLYRVLSWPEPSLGLHRTVFIPSEQRSQAPRASEVHGFKVPGGEVQYEALRPRELKPGQRVALFVHGFNSDTPWMIGGPAQFLAEHGARYDHLLAFDYESFNTGVNDNGQALAHALKTSGFGPDDGIHLDIFAHSMGTLVSRAMIEHWGGDAWVDRCFLAGPPNLGTPLAEAKRLIPWLVTLLLNQVSPTPPALIASWALKKISKDTIGPNDLRAGSELLAQLNNTARRASVPYYILAGRNEIPAQTQGPWRRFAQKLDQMTDTLLDLIFRDDNDKVLALRSMQTVRNGKYPRELLNTRVVPCDHFGYFKEKIGGEQLLAWLKTTPDQARCGDTLKAAERQ